MTNPSDSLEQLMDSGDTELPQFATVMRGYDRGQVDDYVARLNDFLADAEQRAQRAENNVTDVIRRNERLTEELRQAIDRRQHHRSGEPYEGLGDRIEHILRLAGEEADNIRDQARAEADQILADVRRRNDTERASAERELSAVAERRDMVVAELRRVQDVLATLGLRQDVVAEIVAEAGATETTGPSGVLPAAAGGTAEVSEDDETRVIQLPTAAAET